MKLGEKLILNTPNSEDEGKLKRAIWTLAVLSCILSMAWPASGGLLTIIVLFVGGALFLAWERDVNVIADRPAGASVLSSVEKKSAALPKPGEDEEAQR